MKLQKLLTASRRLLNAPETPHLSPAGARTETDKRLRVQKVAADEKNKMPYLRRYVSLHELR